jgi:hypothetical protein
MKKRVLIMVFVLAPLLSVMAGTPFVSLGEANPNWRPWETNEPDEYAKAPVISISSPANNTVLNEDTVYLSFSVDVGETETDLELVFVRYETDWQHDNIASFLPRWNSVSFSHEVNLTGIPEGAHSIAFQAIERGTYKNRLFQINSSETILFTIDANPITDIPEFPSWTIMSLFMATTLSAVIVYRRLTKKASKP